MKNKLKRTTTLDSALSATTTLGGSSIFSSESRDKEIYLKRAQGSSRRSSTTEKKTKGFFLKVFLTQSHSSAAVGFYDSLSGGMNNDSLIRKKRIFERASKAKYYKEQMNNPDFRGKGLQDEIWDIIISQLDSTYVVKLLTILLRSTSSPRLCATLKRKLFGRGFLLANDRSLFPLYPKYDFCATMAEIFHYEFVTDVDLKDYDVQIAFTSATNRTFSGVSENSKYNVFNIEWLNKFLLKTPSGVKVSVYGFGNRLSELINNLCESYGSIIKHIEFEGSYSAEEQYECFKALKRLQGLQSILFINTRYSWPINDNLKQISWEELTKLKIVVFYRVYFPLNSSGALNMKFPLSLEKFTSRYCKQELEYVLPKLLTHISLLACNLKLISSSFLSPDHNTEVVDLRGTDIDSQFLEDLKRISIIRGVDFHSGELKY